MTTERSRHNRPVTNELHPRIYLAMLALVLWYVASVWLFFSSVPYMSIVCVVVSGFFFIYTLLPGALWLTWRRHPDPDAVPRDDVSFHDWMSGEIDTYHGRRKARDAAIEVLLPIASVAFGMTAMGIVMRLTEAGVV